MSDSTGSSSSSRIPYPAIDVWIERIVDQIVYSFSEEQLEAWDSGTTRLRVPHNVPVSMKFWTLEVGDDRFEIPAGIDRSRGTGKTYYIACLYTIWCLRNPDLWIHLREPKDSEPYYSNNSLFKQVLSIEEKYLASTPFALEIRNGNMIRGVPRK